MNIGLDHIESTRLARIGGGFSPLPEKAAVGYSRLGLFWLPAVLIAGFGVSILLSDSVGDTAESEPVQLATAVPEPVPSPGAAIAQDRSAFTAPTTPEEATTPTEMAPVDGLRIASQSWRRGGLGSKALVTFTLHNGNDYAVKNIEISCAFARRDGSHLTGRKRLIPDTVGMKSRKTFARMHVGFVNINANQAKCSLVTASRI